MEKYYKDEQGDILILFAVALIMIILFIGLATDVILAYNKRDKIQEIGNIMVEARMDMGEEVWNSYNPEATLRDITNDIAIKNGIRTDQVEVYWEEDYLGPNRRQAIVTIDITDVYECAVLGMLGLREIPIHVRIRGIQHKGSGSGIWNPYY
ncbi:MAG TPA: Tad domain-containing protein [Tissierellaceae bacterium]